jgi:toxin ParE1/3/4
MSRFLVSPEAQQDLLVIWEFIPRHSIDAANRVVAEFYETFAALAKTPEQGYQRADLIKRPIRFFLLYSYLIIYRPLEEAVQIMTVVHGNRDLKRLLKDRSL